VGFAVDAADGGASVCHPAGGEFEHG
jgi:hypothetical protein